MNKQKKNGSRGIEWTDYTWNPVGGCLHACAWTMPDGTTAECYAKTVAERVAQKVYPQGFAHHYWRPDALNEPSKLKQPARIFMDSMSDLMGHWVPDEQIAAVLDVCAKNPQHTFQLLTKNAPRLEKWEFPDNVWVGVSAPPTYFMGRKLSDDQQIRMWYRARDALMNAKASIRWMSIEPLSFDLAEYMFPHMIPFEWVVIGAASNGARIYQPNPQWVSKLLKRLAGMPVFFKGNLRGNPAANPWREEFPEAVRV